MVIQYDTVARFSEALLATTMNIRPILGHLLQLVPTTMLSAIQWMVAHGIMVDTMQAVAVSGMEQPT
jgi:hypothetical protein